MGKPILLVVQRQFQVFEHAAQAEMFLALLRRAVADSADDFAHAFDARQQRVEGFSGEQRQRRPFVHRFRRAIHRQHGVAKFFLNRPQQRLDF